MPNATVYGRSILLAALCACAGGKSQDAPPGEDNTIAGTCVVDSAKDEASALTWAPLQKGQICPRADVDYYKISVPAGNDLVDITAGYSTSVTRVDLSVQIIGAGSVADTALDDNLSNIKGTLQIAAGDHVAAVRDVADDERDDGNQYALEFVFAKDPDTHEPNDTTALAKSVDGLPGWFAYGNDQDVYKVTVSTPNLRVSLQNSTAAMAAVKYVLQGPSGNVIGSGSANPGATLVDQVPVPTVGEYFIVLSQEANRAPDRRTEASYTLNVSGRAEPDTHERNDNGASATVLPASPATQSGFIATRGDRDYYALTVGGSGAVVVEVELTFPNNATVQAAFDILVAHPGSTCAQDNQCSELNATCDSDDDCEMSHTCLPSKKCVGGNSCLPGGLCAAPHFVTHATQSGVNRIKTAQPLFDAGTYYIVVHDFQDNEYDDAGQYTLNVTVHPELDSGDIGTRNNLYNPYPLQTSSLQKSAQRAIDITGLLASTGVTGLISYESDEDWFKFDNPCKGASGVQQICELSFDWDQPASDGLRVVFLMRNDDLSVHESFVYTGASTAAQNGLTFGGTAACDQCSFGDTRNAGAYYLQVRDYGNDDYEVARQYRIHMTVGAVGCPAACSYAPDSQCGCYCAASGGCPPGPTGPLPP